MRFGKWLLADTPWNHTQLHGGNANRPAGRGRQQETPVHGTSNWGRGGFARGARDGGRGQGVVPFASENRKRSSAEARLEGSPAKGTPFGNVSTTAPPMLQWKETGIILTENEGAKQKLNFAEEGKEKNYVPREGTPPPPSSTRE